VSNGPSYRLVAPDPTRLAPPALDDDQQRVVDHPGGPLLVLAGPGTGKTTTLVEAIVDRIEHRGADPSSVLALTFSRKAAEQLRDRVTARLGRTLSSPISSTFHSSPTASSAATRPPSCTPRRSRLLSAPEQDVVLQQLLTREGRSPCAGPTACARAVGTRGFAAEVHAVLRRAREKGLDPRRSRARPSRRARVRAAGLFLEQYLDVLDARAPSTTPT
jgi:superfamily I DNA/RNA helicase